MSQKIITIVNDTNCNLYAVSNINTTPQIPPHGSTTLPIGYDRVLIGIDTCGHNPNGFPTNFLMLNVYTIQEGGNIYITLVKSPQGNYFYVIYNLSYGGYKAFFTTPGSVQCDC
ncbi:MAG: hypothetical protein QW478_00285 [Candidatus Micrarchaeaceae archaeon]